MPASSRSCAYSSASKCSKVRSGMKSSNGAPPKCSWCQPPISGIGQVGCSTMSGLVSRKPQYQSAYSCSGAKAGTVAMFACTNIPYRDCRNQFGAGMSCSLHYRRRPMSRRGDQVVITNRKARHDYFVLDAFECGVMLKGPEVKSIRNGRANLQDAFARVEDGAGRM